MSHSARSSLLAILSFNSPWKKLFLKFCCVCFWAITGKLGKNKLQVEMMDCVLSHKMSGPVDRGNTKTNAPDKKG